jgi:hypothetical protein
MSLIITSVDAADGVVKDHTVVGAISISGHTHHQRSTPQLLRGLGDNLLELKFDDDGLSGGREAAKRVAAEGFTEEAFNRNTRPVWVNLSQIRSILAFGASQPAFFSEKSVETSYILMHCFAGYSRSPAAMLACLAQGFGAGRDAAAVAALDRLSGYCRPSPMLIAGADILLRRGGNLFQAAKTFGYI